MIGYGSDNQGVEAVVNRVVGRQLVILPVERHPDNGHKALCPSSAAANMAAQMAQIILDSYGRGLRRPRGHCMYARAQHHPNNMELADGKVHTTVAKMCNQMKGQFLYTETQVHEEVISGSVSNSI